ncbi:MAG: hypothetical protein ACYC6X_03000 [Minisyncoccota bacterium]
MTATTTTDAIAQVNTLATHTALSVSSVVSNFLIILILVAVFFLFAWYVGRGPFVAVVLAFYAAYAVYLVFPYLSYLPTAPAATALLAHIGLYAGLTFLFYVILRRVVVSDFLYIGLFGLIALSFFAATFLLALGYHVFAIASIYHFTPAVDILFSPNQYFFWWFIAPAVGLFFLAR